MGQPAIKSMLNGFRYEEAFARNLGWVSVAEQDKLKTACVAIAGLGGAGGFQVQALARLGVGKFKIADLDSFELSNTNRQMGASTETVGQAKVDVMKRMILSINPEAVIETYSDGIHYRNIDLFLAGVDVALDGIDFFAIETKMLLFEECHRREIPAVTSCPLGFGASVIVFDSKGMFYRDYFDLKNHMNDHDKRFALAFGLSPTPLCLSYMGPDAMDMENGRAGSVSPGLMLVGSLSATETVKLILGKGKVRICPDMFQIDLMTQRVRIKTYRMGMRSPWLKLKKKLILHYLSTRKSPRS